MRNLLFKGFPFSYRCWKCENQYTISNINVFALYTIPAEADCEIVLSCVFQASKRQPGTSGRLHRTVTGEWVWSSEEEGGESSDEEVRSTAFLLNS